MSKNPRQSALYWLSRRDYTQQEIRQKLQTKGYDAEVIQTVLADLVQEGLINESRFTENFIHWRRERGYGPKRISLELQARGIPDYIIAEHLEITDNAWSTAARKVWQKHFKGKQPKDFKERAKQMRFLQYRGFSRDHIENVLVEVEELTM